MSDGGKRRKIKLRLGGSPTGSRAGSPGVGRAGSGGSRAASPSAQFQGNSTSFFGVRMRSTANCFTSSISKRKSTVARSWAYSTS